MSRLKRAFPFTYKLFMKIAEPRIIRLLHFTIYGFMLAAGIGVVARPTPHFDNVLGNPLVYIMGGFIISGALLSLVSVLPGIWWLERVGLILLATGMLSYIVVVIAVDGSMTRIGISASLIMSFVLRWLEIRRYQLAPRED